MTTPSSPASSSSGSHPAGAPFPPVRVRVMAPDEVGLAIDRAAAEGWNPGLHDAVCFSAADPAGFLVAELEGEPVGCISAVRYGDDFGFLGLYIVRPGYRGRGYGIALWKAALAHLAGRNIGLDGVVAQQENYRKSGFTLAHRNVRYERPAAAAPDSAAPEHGTPGAQGASEGGAQRDAEILPLNQIPFPELLEYDSRMFAAAREAFLRCWITRPGTTARAVRNSAGRLAGYGVVRPCRVGHKIGPLFADSPEIADRLFRSLAGSVSPAAPLYLDVPQINPAAVALAERHGLVPVFETARMYTQRDPGLPLHRIFGITSFELG